MMLPPRIAWLVLVLAIASQAAGAERGGADPASQGADALLARMTADEKFTLLHGYFPRFMQPRPAGVPITAGYVPGVPRLGVPALIESDASLGVSNAGRGADDDALALPSGLALAASWDPEIAFAGGATIAREARQKGFNVLLAGGVNLTRDPFNGRNFEYLGEDPLLAGVMAGASIRGIQSQHVLSTTKHFALNAQETGRHVLDARIGEAGLRESDLLAFELAIEQGRPGSVMCAYNKVGGAYACENGPLLDGVLKQDWRYPGFVMSDWGAVHSAAAATQGLDQESGSELDRQVFFDKSLRAALAAGAVSQARVDDMARRVLRSMAAAGLLDPAPPPGPLDVAADAPVAQRAAEAGIVLLKNAGGLLPLAAGARRILVVGGHADRGVLSGGGSSQVIPRGSLKLPPPADAPKWLAGVFYHPSPPLAAIRAQALGAEVAFDDGTDPARAAQAARRADVVVLVAEQWATEGMDAPLRLSGEQEALIAAVAAANPRLVVVLETGGPVFMPWLDRAPAVVEAWYPGHRGGEAIARVLFGAVNPSGRLPVTFAASPAQLPRPEPVGLGRSAPEGFAPSTDPGFSVDYAEGSSVGYRRFAERGERPLFPFGYGLSYTRFRYGGLEVRGGATLSLAATVANIGPRAGAETVQFYLRSGPARRQQRLIGFRKVLLGPGERRRVQVMVDRRLLADWDVARHRWRLDAGTYTVFAGPDAASSALTGAARVDAAMLTP